MKNHRRQFLQLGAASASLGLMPHNVLGRVNALAAQLDKVADAPVLKTDFFKQPVKIQTVELLKNGKQFVVRVRSTEGATGKRTSRFAKGIRCLTVYSNIP